MKYWYICYNKSTSLYAISPNEENSIVRFNSFDMAYQYMNTLNGVKINNYSRWTLNSSI